MTVKPAPGRLARLRCQRCKAEYLGPVRAGEFVCQPCMLGTRETASGYTRVVSFDRSMPDRYYVLTEPDRTLPATFYEAIGALGPALMGVGSDAPTPAAAGSVAEFVRCMRALIVWAGDPSLRDLERRAGVGRLPRSSLSDALRRTDRLPPLDLVAALVKACGADTRVPAWVAAWKRLRIAQLETAA